MSSPLSPPDDVTQWLRLLDEGAAAGASNELFERLYAELRRLVTREEIRVPAVQRVLSRLHEYADEARLATTSGTVRIDLTRDDARAFMAVAAEVHIETHVTRYALDDANTALADLRSGRLSGAAVLAP